MTASGPSPPPSPPTSSGSSTTGSTRTTRSTKITSSLSAPPDRARPNVGDISDDDEDEIRQRAGEVAVKLAGKGIIILDEADKIRIHPLDRREDSFFQRSIQQTLLKIIEGGTGFGEHPLTPRIDTTDILFIFSGAFIGLDEITKRRLRPEAEPETTLGFRPAPANPDPEPKTAPQVTQENLTARDLIPTTEDLIEFGYIPELVGRITLRCRYNPITAETLYNILRESDISPAKEFQKMFRRTRNNLEYTNNALMEIARQAEKLQTGVRGLRNIIGDIAYPIYYELSGKTNQRVLITQRTVNGEAPATIRTFSCESEPPSGPSPAKANRRQDPPSPNAASQAGETASPATAKRPRNRFIPHSHKNTAPVNA